MLEYSFCDMWQERWVFVVEEVLGCAEYIWLPPSFHGNVCKPSLNDNPSWYHLPYQGAPLDKEDNLCSLRCDGDCMFVKGREQHFDNQSGGAFQ